MPKELGIGIVVQQRWLLAREVACPIQQQSVTHNHSEHALLLQNGALFKCFVE